MSGRSHLLEFIAVGDSFLLVTYLQERQSYKETLSSDSCSLACSDGKSTTTLWAVKEGSF
jgi:hypothetical protein